MTDGPGPDDSTTGGGSRKVSVGIWLIAGIIVTFLIGIGMLMTLGTQRSGDPIPIDATPYYMPGDAPPP